MIMTFLCINVFYDSDENYLHSASQIFLTMQAETTDDETSVKLAAE